MQTTRSRTIVAATLTAFAFLGGCSSGDSAATTTTAVTQPATTVTTKPVAALQAALLSPADVPGSTGTPPGPDMSDLSACFPGNPLGAKTDPNEAKGQDLSLADPSGVQRQYSASARQGTTEQATAFVTTFASPTGSACAVNAFKAAFSNDPKPPKLDASGLSGTATTAAVADGGTLLTLTGNLTADGTPVPAGVDLVVFHRGPIVVLLSVATIGGPNVTGQAVELANTMAGRLT